MLIYCTLSSSSFLIRWYHICIHSQRGLLIWHMAHWIVLTGASYPSLTSQGKTSPTVTKAEKKYLTTRRATLRPTKTPRRRSKGAARPQGGCIATAEGSNSDRSQLRWRRRRRNEQQEAGREAPTNHTLRDKEDQGLGVFEAWWVAPTKPLQLDGTTTCARLVNRCNRTDFPLTHHRWEKHNVRKPSLDGNYYSLHYIAYFRPIFQRWANNSVFE